ncbi:DNA polymerase III subunit gamma/tau [Candidatus Parcubacteria bacterium]|nr:DNA polymerase III subunit gamma/tau [Candidatus Parcubacteria bacterium]
MGQAFYRKYRSKTFDEVVGQDHLITILKNTLKNDNLSHAYLFTGPRGVGKTSVARILAKNVNAVAPEDTNFYSDIIEIDAASNRRIEEIRELRDKIAIAPSQLKYKVYIVDEVHMLTREAFNALLKTLEEPPAHAIFVLATTDFHKVPDTITSRCMRLNFKMISQQDLTKSLNKIAKKEQISIEEEALELIAEFSGGSFRDALSLLDQMSSTGSKIDVSLVELTLGIANKQSIGELIESIAASDTSAIFQQIQTMVDSGATPDQINVQLSGKLRKSLITKDGVNISSRQAIELIENLNSMYSFQNHRIALELAILKVIKPGTVEPVKASAELNEPADNSYEPPEANQRSFDEPVEKKPDQNYNDAGKLWQDILVKLKTENSTLYGIARMAEPSLEANKLTLTFKFPFHLKQMTHPKNKSLVERISKQVKNGVELDVISSGKKDGSNPPEKFSSKKSSDDLKSISNIFGSAEVLES